MKADWYIRGWWSTLKRVLGGWCVPSSRLSRVPVSPLYLIFYILYFVFSSPLAAQDIIIGGNVYGGGNQGNVDGNATVTVKEGDINKVFGGARMANVGGRTVLDIANTETTAIIINQAYGGNDIAGSIGTDATLPTQPTAIKRVAADETNPKKNAVDNTWNSFVHIGGNTGAITETGDGGSENMQNALYIGALFAGGNGAYDYEQVTADGKTTHSIYLKPKASNPTPIATKVTDEGEVGFLLPELDKTYLEIEGGTIAYAFGGGNNATVKEKTLIYLDNPTKVVTSFKQNGEDQVSNKRRQKAAGINPGFYSHFSSPEFQIGQLFGGNNMAEMSIMPSWNLQSGKVRNLYSGGNKGDMTSEVGLLLEINPAPLNTSSPYVFDATKNDSTLKINNVYGGCRMADVHPKKPDGSTPEHVYNLEGYHFPNELAARTLVRGGDIKNVYGGNDIQGKVYFGNAVGVYTSISGDIYGGGNGAYPYTDNADLKDDLTYGDVYYAPGSNSVAALNATRPNAEQVSIRIAGTAEKNTIIKGSIFCGGNCATLESDRPNPMAELKIGSYSIADKVFLGNNGENMAHPEMLKLYAGSVQDENDVVRDFSSLTLTDADTFAEFMEGAAMSHIPKVVFDDAKRGDDQSYIPYSSQIGSLYLGGNVGSMTYAGTNVMDLDAQIYIYNKVVGGCNAAYVEVQEDNGTPLNARFEGGVIGSKSERASYTDAAGKIKDRLVMNFNGTQIHPMRWNDAGTELEWNTAKWEENYVAVPSGTALTVGKAYYTSSKGDGKFIAGADEKAGASTYEHQHGFVNIDTTNPDDDHARRLLDGNVYGGCYESGNMNGNVVINIDGQLINRDITFAETTTDGEGNETITGARNSGVILSEQSLDLLSLGLTTFGAGKGKDTEVWGSTTVNLNNGYLFQIFGGGDEGIVGRPVDTSSEPDNTIDRSGSLHTNGKKFAYNEAYSTYVNLSGSQPIYDDEEDDLDLAEAEYLYGGGNEGDVCGSTYVNLGNGRIYDSFGGASDGYILGHAETYIGRSGVDEEGKDILGFPWIRDYVYGANDFGGTIVRSKDFTDRVRPAILDWLHPTDTDSDGKKDVLTATAYVEYKQGHMLQIYGGNYGDYDYTNEDYQPECGRPSINSSFVNLCPIDHTGNSIDEKVFGGGEGHAKDREGDKMQHRSYILVNIPDDMEDFSNLEIFGAGNNNGIGMGVDKEIANTAAKADSASAIIDLVSGQISNVFGGSYNEGITRRTVINVPEESTIQLDSLFGGAYGTQILPPCDVYESNVSYRNTSEKARVRGAIFGGNNNERRTVFTHVNISSPVWADNKNLSKVYGAGRGVDTWSEYTQVNLLSGAKVKEVYGGGEMGHVLNAESVEKYMELYKKGPSPQIAAQDPYWKNVPDLWEDDVNRIVAPKYTALWAADWKDTWTIGEYYTPNEDYSNYAANAETNLSNSALVWTAEMDERDMSSLTEEQRTRNQNKYNTNVLIHEGATVEGYAYGGGYGESAIERSGDIYGSTYIALLGGTVTKDIYAAGTAGGVSDLFGAENFVASANAYIKGGTVRNVYGGGWQGHVGSHEGGISTSTAKDILGETHVVIGNAEADSSDVTTGYTTGFPAIQRNVYGGGEGGSIYGTANLKINNGFIGFMFEDVEGKTYPYFKDHYIENTTEKTKDDLDGNGNAFGGGYVVSSYVDKSNITMYGGTIRGSLYGGGELGPIGRGTKMEGASTTYGMVNQDAVIYRPGHTRLTMYGGHVLRNVFGGGRGKDSWGGDGWKADAEPDLSSKGNVFGQTEVYIYGGEVGTEEGMTRNFGNVFGGCDEGYVYSAYEEDGKFFIGNKAGKRYNKGISPSDKENYNYQGYYYKHKTKNAITEGVDTYGFFINGKGERYFTEDCKVLVEPWCKASASVNINSTDYVAGDYVPTSALNTMKSKTEDSGRWSKLDPTGIIIHNAVFGGGNIALGSELYANTETVFGNATASIHDVYNRDLITIGTGYTGGLYGDGNLTFVDGYRELNITNYGTDYYHIATSISIDAYHELPVREQAYYELKYKCVAPCTDNEETTYTPGATVPHDELLVLFAERSDILDASGKPKKEYWVENGVVSAYAGRIMNTIQRADFCGVFGSRMVMRGAKDRVPTEVDATNYTINRVREVSLNKMDSPAGDTSDENKMHGNYFGIYNTVNYLGALTSDVDFHSVRTTNANLAANPGLAADGSTTFAQWKADNLLYRTRNNGSCHNHLALASGVYLELTTEMSTGNDLYEKDWGLITGVVELDLINVQTGIGGGYVYAKNEHGKRDDSTISTTTLADLNSTAVSQWDFKYKTDDEDKVAWETSGNFIHSSQTIIDDCYNISNKYKTGYHAPDGVPAHYWYVKGEVYVYDQYISAYTGTPNAYSKNVEIPLTISAASHGTMTLMNVKPNLYAYYSTYTNENTNTKLGVNQKIVINNVTYQLNDPISYWDWYLLPSSYQKLFVEETMITTAECEVGPGATKEVIPAGYVMLPQEYRRLEDKAVSKDLEDDDIEGEVKTVVVNDEDMAFNKIFHSSNNMAHGTGYLLTYEMTNPGIWRTWYTERESATADKIDVETYKDLELTTVGSVLGKDAYEDGPTYHLDPSKLGGEDGIVLGQNTYQIADIISKNVEDTYQAITNKPADQAIFEPAYITKEYVETYKIDPEDPTKKNEIEQHLQPGATLAQSQYKSSRWESLYDSEHPETSKVTPAFICTSTIQLSETNFIFINDLMTEDEKDALMTAYPGLADDIDKCVVQAYYCTTPGLYGGNYYETGKNYRALEAWSAMSNEDRQKFTFNYDALDLLIDSKFGTKVDGTQQKEGRKYQYDGESYTFNVATASDEKKESMIYSLSKPVDYTATYEGITKLTYKDADDKDHEVAVGAELNRVQFESIPNERRHYAPIKVEAAGDYYVVNESFVHGDTPYATGATMDESSYNDLTDDEKEQYITTLSFSAEDLVADPLNPGHYKPYYYCRESYQVNELGEGQSVTSSKGKHVGTTYNSGDVVPQGIVITPGNYTNLHNKQEEFTIHGIAPMETSTLYVSRNSDINDLSKEKIITVVYQYNYEESDESGMHITPVSERHVVNIHITFESGIPTVEDILPPEIVLPGTSITMRVPNVTPGAYEILSGGWELFEKERDAESHTNYVSYTPSVDPLYWYQDDYYLAYYAMTYLGKTYSNHVQVSVANYHDLKRVMSDANKQHHMYIDNKHVKRDPKIYINDYSHDETGNTNGVDELKRLFDLSVLEDPAVDGDGLITSGAFEGHKPLDSFVKGGKGLEIFLRSDQIHPDNTAVANEWTPIANNVGECFNGVLHGDGYTISGLDNSLFNHLCGEVYNLGVTGSFTSAGVADTGEGYVENCWVKTTGTPAADVQAVFGNPSRLGSDGLVQVVNSYYPESNSFTVPTGEAAKHGVPIQKPDKAFLNGEVAYDLNGFYLYKRYYDHASSLGGTLSNYNYWQPGNATPQLGKYGSNPDLCSSGYKPAAASESYVPQKYVEDRFADGDFRYADGTIPTWDDERLYIDAEDDEKEYFFPIWPDDYLFFGQALNYDYEGRTHQDVPTAIRRVDGRVDTEDTSNRVYRAPAYFRNNRMSVAHFNPYAIFAQSKKGDASKLAYKDMTAIDFTGYQDNGFVVGLAYRDGTNWTPTVHATPTGFYPPLLDDDGLINFHNEDLTRNLLAYTFEPGGNTTATEKTGTAVSKALNEPPYAEVNPNPSHHYRIVERADAAVVKGHWVEKEEDGYTSIRDHFLVDAQDFNAPIGYQFDDDHLIWYQRTPKANEFVDDSKGWQAISLPFSAELVTTHQKGEITHFYGNSEESKNATHTKIGHEYWLREFKDITASGEPVVATATFSYPAATPSYNKEYTNTFLWDYYYEGNHSQKDLNLDKYQTYYKTDHTHKQYTKLGNGKAYLLGLPGGRYYEFDLSGTFKPTTTDETRPAKLDLQTITFASDKGENIGVSDYETAGDTRSYNSKDYTFKPSYMNEVIDGDLVTGYTLNNDGDSYAKVAAETKVNVSAFRPYFLSSASPGVKGTADYIFFSSVSDSFGEEHEDEGIGDGTLSITSRLRHIILKSTLKEPKAVHIYNASGIHVSIVTINPGQTIIVPVNAPGIYIVNQTKIAVK